MKKVYTSRELYAEFGTSSTAMLNVLNRYDVKPIKVVIAGMRTSRFWGADARDALYDWRNASAAPVAMEPVPVEPTPPSVSLTSLFVAQQKYLQDIQARTVTIERMMAQLANDLGGMSALPAGFDDKEARQ